MPHNGLQHHSCLMGDVGVRWRGRTEEIAGAGDLEVLDSNLEAAQCAMPPCGRNRGCATSRHASSLLIGIVKWFGSGGGAW